MAACGRGAFFAKPIVLIVAVTGSGAAIPRRSGGFADVGMMIEDLHRQRIFTRDHQVENLSGAGRAFGNVLTLELLQVGLACFLSHREQMLPMNWEAPEPRLVDHIIWPFQRGCSRSS